VVAGDEDRLALAAEPLAERTQDRLGGLHRLYGAALEQLDHVAQQDEPVGPVQRLQQGRKRGGAPQDVTPEARAEVQVRDDEGPHVWRR
jgi:hypothetical protein